MRNWLPIPQAPRLEYGRLANQFHLALHRKWIEGARSGEDLMGSSEISPASRSNAIAQAVQTMQVVPVAAR